jgi:hypothetical protein
VERSDFQKTEARIQVIISFAQSLNPFFLCPYGWRSVEEQKKNGGERMPTITLKLELYRPTRAKQDMYERMTQINTEFANWLLFHPEINKATSKMVKPQKSRHEKNTLDYAAS